MPGTPKKKATPKKLTVKVHCDLEGREDQWAEYKKKVKWPVMRQVVRVASLLDALDDDNEDLTALDTALGEIEKLVARCVVDWNWKSEDGKEDLPLPAVGSEAWDELDQEEAFWLFGAIPIQKKTPEEAKNSESP